MMASSSRVAAFDDQNQIDKVEEFGFGKAEVEIVWACHEFVD
jgi:hypothetical protein